MILELFAYPVRLLLAHGYIALFIWSVMEGEIGLVLAGWLAQQGRVFSYEDVIWVATVGALIGDTITFSIGKFFEKKALTWLDAHPDKKQLAHRWIRRYGPFIIIFERFIYGTHIPVLLTLGLTGYSYLKFYFYEIIGVVLWAVTFTSIGYYFGDTAIQFIVLIQKNMLALLFILIVLIWLFKAKKEESDT